MIRAGAVRSDQRCKIDAGAGGRMSAGRDNLQGNQRPLQCGFVGLQRRQSAPPWSCWPGAPEPPRPRIRQPGRPSPQRLTPRYPPPYSAPSARRSCSLPCRWSGCPICGAAARQPVSTAAAWCNTPIPNAGLQLPRTAAEQLKAATPLTLEDAVAGDLLFFKRPEPDLTRRHLSGRRPFRTRPQWRQPRLAR